MDWSSDVCSSDLRWCSKASPFSGRTGSRWRSGAWNKRDCVRARVCTQLPRDRGLKQNGSVRGEKAQEYVDISRLLDEAMGHFDQIPPLAQLDRKSVGSGKSVSVSLDQGGR